MGQERIVKKAVALRYEPGADAAPRITATGRREMAKRIIELARKHKIHIKEDPDLVEVLSRLDLDQEIPPDLYVVVAELLAFIYTVNRNKRPQ